jgi:DNA repair protein RadC
MTTNTVKSEDKLIYDASNPEANLAIASASAKLRRENVILSQARDIIIGRFERDGVDALTSPAQTREYLQTLLGASEHEIFGVLMLDNRNRVIAWREMFRGTIDGASVYPREVVKQALADNAAAVIFAHNHPSGIPEPSQADIRITERLNKALALVDIRVLDHVIIGEKTTSLAERGLI